MAGIAYPKCQIKLVTQIQATNSYKYPMASPPPKKNIKFSFVFRSYSNIVQIDT